MSSTTPLSEATEATALYRLYDGSGVLLYVGISNNPEQRWRQHAYRVPWWPEVGAWRVEWHPSRVEALRAEAQAIHDEHPRFNAQRPGPHTEIRQGRPKPVWDLTELLEVQAHREKERERIRMERRRRAWYADMRFGRAIARARDRGISQKAIGDKADLSREQVRRLEDAWRAALAAGEVSDADLDG